MQLELVRKRKTRTRSCQVQSYRRKQGRKSHFSFNSKNMRPVEKLLPVKAGKNFRTSRHQRRICHERFKRSEDGKADLIILACSKRKSLPLCHGGNPCCTKIHIQIKMHQKTTKKNNLQALFADPLSRQFYKLLAFGDK